MAKKPVETLAKYGINISGDVEFSPVVPPKHVVEEALVNIVAASEFASDEGFASADSFAFWLFLIFIAT